MTGRFGGAGASAPSRRTALRRHGQPRRSKATVEEDRGKAGERDAWTRGEGVLAGVAGTMGDAREGEMRGRTRLKFNTARSAVGVCHHPTFPPMKRLATQQRKACLNAPAASRLALSLAGRMLHPAPACARSRLQDKKIGECCEMVPLGLSSAWRVPPQSSHERRDGAWRDLAAHRPLAGKKQRVLTEEAPVPSPRGRPRGDESRDPVARPCRRCPTCRLRSKRAADECSIGCA